MMLLCRCPNALPRDHTLELDGKPWCSWCKSVPRPDWTITDPPADIAHYAGTDQDCYPVPATKVRLKCPCGGQWIPLKKDCFPLLSQCERCRADGPFWADLESARNDAELSEFDKVRL